MVHEEEGLLRHCGFATLGNVQVGVGKVEHSQSAGQELTVDQPIQGATLRIRLLEQLRWFSTKPNVQITRSDEQRVADFLELGELMCRDALAREESCGCHLREEYQTSEGEALRNDDQFCHVAAWQFQGLDAEPTRHQEDLIFEEVRLVERSYKQ